MRHITGAIIIVLLFATVGFAQTATVVKNAPISVQPDLTGTMTPLRVAAVGTVFNVVGAEGEWLQVEFQDPQWGLRTGWVRSELVAIQRPELQPMDLSVRQAVPAAAPPSPRPPTRPCLIVKIYQKKAADALIRWTGPKSFNYIEGDFPNGVKFRNELNDKHVREIQEKGGHVVVIKPDYALPDLEDARRSCRVWQEAKQ